MANNIEETLLLPTNPDAEPPLKSKIGKELKLIWRVAIPGVISRVTSFGLIVVTQMFLGHVGAVVLAAFALDQTVILRFVNAIMIGMSSATETLCGQAFGAQQYHMMGIYLQRSWIVNLSTVTVCVPFFIFAKQILIAIGQDKSVAEAAGVVSLWLIPVSYSFAFTFSTQMYLQSQMKNKIVAWLTAPCFLLHIALSFLLVIALNLGLAGALIPFISVNWIIAIGCIVYIVGGWCPETWRGFDMAALSSLWPVVKLSAASGLMLCLEMWYTAIIVLLAGYLPDAEIEISAFSICINVNVWQLMFTFGLLTASSVRVSNELGKGDAKAAKFAMKVIFFIAVIIGVVSFIICIVFDRQIAYLFTSDDSVAATVTSLSVPLAFSVLLNSIQSTLNGIAVGSGLQATVAFVNLGSYYIVGLPVGACLGYLTDLKIKGFWIGLLSGVVLQVMFLGILIWRCDWDEQVKKASGRLSRWYVKPMESESNSNSEA